MSRSVLLTMKDNQHRTTKVASAPSRRLPELDALRGLLLIGMTLTHLPTHASLYAYQPLGFVAAAEGFIFVSAILTGRIYGRIFLAEGIRAAARRLCERAAKLYTYHLLLLFVAFTVVAGIAVRSHQPALQGLLDFYLARPFLAMLSSILLVYCPPLLDILPMYIVFLLLTPVALFVGQRWGWRYVLLPTGALWVAAQFGLREMIYARMVHWTGLAVPLQNTGAFNLYAWQFLWAVGLWLGMGAPERVVKWLTSRTAVITAFVIAAAFFVMRYQLFPYLAAHPVDQGVAWMIFDKWRLGPFRVINFTALAILFSAARPYVARWLAVEPLVVLGQSSLEVFSIHLLFCFGALAWVGNGDGAPFRDQLSIIVITFTGLFILAYYRFEKKRQAKSGAAPVILKPTAGLDATRSAA